jgi:hypothetical protein
MAREELKLDVSVAGIEQIEKLSVSLRNLITSSVGMTRRTQNMDAAQRALSQAVGVTNKGLNEHAKTIGQVRTNQRALGNELNNLRNAIKQTDARIKSLNTSFAEKEALRQFNNQLKTTERNLERIRPRALISDLRSLSVQFKKAGKDAQFVGRSLIIGLTTPIMMFANRGLDAFKAFDAELVRLKKILGEAFLGNEQKGFIALLDQEREGLEKLGYSLESVTSRMDAFNQVTFQMSQKFGVSRDLVTAVTADFAELGIASTDVLLGLADVTNQLSVLGSMDISQSQELLQTMFLGTIRSMDLMGREFSSALEKQEVALEAATNQLYLFNAIENNTALSFRDMAESIPEASSAATIFGLTMTQTAAMLAPMKAAGIDVKTAANGLKVALQRLATPTGVLQDTMAGLTARVGESGEELRAYFDEISGVGIHSIQSLVDATNLLRQETDDEAVIKFYAQLFEKRQATRMLTSIDSLIQFQKELNSTAIQPTGETLANILEGIAAKAGFASQGLMTTVRTIEDFTNITKVANAQVGESVGGVSEAVTQGQIDSAKKARQMFRDYVSDVEKNSEEGIQVVDQLSSQAGKALLVELLGAANAQQLAQEELDIALASTSKQIDRMRIAFKNIATDIISSAEPAIRAVSTAVVNAAEAISKLPAGVKQLMIVFAGAVAAIGPLVFIFGQVKLAAGVMGGVLFKMLPGVNALSAETLAATPGLLKMKNAVTLQGDAFTTSASRMQRFIATVSSGRGPIARMARAYGEATGILSKQFTAPQDVLARVGMTSAAGEAALNTLDARMNEIAAKTTGILASGGETAGNNILDGALKAAVSLKGDSEIIHNKIVSAAAEAKAILQSTKINPRDLIQGPMGPFPSSPLQPTQSLRAIPSVAAAGVLELADGPYPSMPIKQMDAFTRSLDAVSVQTRGLASSITDQVITREGVMAEIQNRMARSGFSPADLSGVSIKTSQFGAFEGAAKASGEFISDAQLKMAKQAADIQGEVLAQAYGAFDPLGQDTKFIRSFNEVQSKIDAAARITGPQDIIGREGLIAPTGGLVTAAGGALPGLKKGIEIPQLEIVKKDLIIPTKTISTAEALEGVKRDVTYRPKMAPQVMPEVKKGRFDWLKNFFKNLSQSFKNFLKLFPGKLLEGFRKLGSIVKSFGSTFVFIGAYLSKFVVGGLGAVIKKLMPISRLINIIKVGFIGFTFAGLIAGVALLLPFIKAIIDNFSLFREKIQPGVDRLTATFKILKEIGSALLSPFKDLFAALSGGSEASDKVEKVANIFNKLSGFVFRASLKIQEFVEEYVVPFMKKAFGAFMTIVNGFKNIVKGAIAMKNGVAGAGNQMKEGLKAVGMGILQFFLGTLAPALINVFAAIVKGAFKILLKLVENLPTIIAYMVQIFLELLPHALKVFRFIVVKGLTLLAHLPEGIGFILDKAINLFTDFVRMTIDALGPIAQFFAKVFGVNTVLSTFDAVGGALSAIGSGATSAAMAGVNALDGALESLVETVSDIDTGGIVDFGKELSAKLGDAMAGAPGAFDSFVDAARDAATNALAGFVPEPVADRLASEMKDTVEEELGDEELYEPTIDAAGDAGESAGENFANKFNDALKDIRQKFVDLVGDYLSNEISDASDKLIDALENQRDAALKVFDDQISVIDKLSQAEEALMREREYIANRRKLLDERELNRQNYVRNRALAIYEGRIDDARMLDLEEQKSSKESAESISDLENKRNQDLRKENLEFLKNQIKEAKQEADEFFKAQIEAFKEASKEITKFAPQTIEDYEQQLNQLTSLATEFAQKNGEQFATTFENMQQKIEQDMPNKAVTPFAFQLDALVAVAAEKYGLLDENVGVLGATLSMLQGIEDRVVANTGINSAFESLTGGLETSANDTSSLIQTAMAGTLTGWETLISENTLISSNFDELLRVLEEDIISIGLDDINDIIEEKDPAQTLLDAITNAQEEILREWRGTVGHITSAVDPLANMMDPMIANILEAQMAIDELGNAATNAGAAVSNAVGAVTPGGTPPGTTTPGGGGAGVGQAARRPPATLALDEIDAVRNWVRVNMAGFSQGVKNKIIDAIVSIESNFQTNRDSNLRRVIYSEVLAGIPEQLVKGQLGVYMSRMYPSITPSTAGGGSVGGPLRLANGGYVRKFGVGGYNVPGFGNQSIPALLHGGEFVMNSKAVSRIGMATLQAMNDMRFKSPGRMGQNQSVTTINKTENINIYVDTFIGEDKWFNEMMDQYNVKMRPINDKKRGAEVRIFDSYSNRAGR